MLDGIRGLAILLVLLHHIAPPGDEQLHYHGISHVRFLCDLFSRFSRSGWIGVDLFFVLSGFLITGILADTRGGKHYFRNFYIRRALRVLPLYYGVLFGVLVILPRMVAITDPDTRYFLAHPVPLWTHTANLAMAFKGQWYFGGKLLDLTHFWSLAIEEQFYLVWPAVILLLPRRGAMAVCAALFLLAPAMRLWLALHGAPDVTIYCNTLCRLDGLALGALLALHLRLPSAPGPELSQSPFGSDFGELSRAEALGRRQPSHAAGGSSHLPRIILIAAGLGLLALAACSGNWTLDRTGPFSQTVTFSVVAVFFAALLVLALRAPRSHPACRFFSHPAMRFLGRYSYGIYVFNSLINPPFVAILPPRRIARLTHSLEVGAMIHTLLEIALTIVVAMLSYHLYEKHFLKLKQTLAPERKAISQDNVPITKPGPTVRLRQRAA